MPTSTTIIGRVGRDPELRFTESGLALCRIPVAVNRNRKKGDQWEEETTWFDVTIFDALAENAASSLSKGDEIIASGYIQQPKSFQKKDGEVGVSLPFVAQEIGPSLRWQTTSSSPTPRNTSGSGQAPARRPAKPAYDASDEPF